VEAKRHVFLTLAEEEASTSSFENSLALELGGKLEDPAALTTGTESTELAGWEGCWAIPCV